MDRGNIFFPLLTVPCAVFHAVILMIFNSCYLEGKFLLQRRKRQIEAYAGKKEVGVSARICVCAFMSMGQRPGEPGGV